MNFEDLTTEEKRILNILKNGSKTILEIQEKTGFNEIVLDNIFYRLRNFIIGFTSYDFFQRYKLKPAGELLLKGYDIPEV